MLKRVETTQYYDTTSLYCLTTYVHTYLLQNTQRIFAANVQKPKVQNFRKPDATCSFLLGVCEDLRGKPSPTSPSSNGLLELQDEVEEAIEEKKKK